MTSNDPATPNGPAGRRRPLGRGPVAAPDEREQPGELEQPGERRVHGEPSPSEAPQRPDSGPPQERELLPEPVYRGDSAARDDAAAPSATDAPAGPGAPQPPHPRGGDEGGAGAGAPVGALDAAEPGGGLTDFGATEASPKTRAGLSGAVVTADASVSGAGGAPVRTADVADAGAVGVPGPAIAAPGGQSASGADASAPDAGVGVPDGDGVFKVRLDNFEGPFDLLLQLISRHKLDVTEVALSKVTDEFMAHIRAMGADWDLDQTTEFLVVAATLLDLKAARLLPAAEVEDEGDLALLEARDLLFARLLQYRAYKQIADIFNARIEDEARRYPRTVGLEPHHAELLPEVVISIGPEGFARLAVKAMQPRAKPQVYVDHIHAPLVSVQEQAQLVVARLKELGEASFRTLVADTEDTLTVVARFLALLELYREKAVALEQEAALGELTVRWTGGDGDAAPTVTDEFDRPPEKAEEAREEKKA
ncbi:segregation and condensation protein A [Streptomyces sp. NPDC014006]|uniref:segregation and condensation protein A n=1 Tax=Streptomyces sp. NPDC014006 TaxID=3364870 RepID=UPI00370198D0